MSCFNGYSITISVGWRFNITKMLCHSMILKIWMHYALCGGRLENRYSNGASIPSQLHRSHPLKTTNVVKTMPCLPSPSLHHKYIGGRNLPFPGKWVEKMTLFKHITYSTPEKMVYWISSFWGPKYGGLCQGLFLTGERHCCSRL